MDAEQDALRRRSMRLLDRLLDRFTAASDQGSREHSDEDAESDDSDDRPPPTAQGLPSEQQPISVMDHPTLAPLSSPRLSPRTPPLAGNVHAMLSRREERGPFHKRARTHVSSQYLPNKLAGRAGKFPNQAFCGQFSKDGEVFMSACQDHHIRFYHTDRLLSARPFKDVEAEEVGWSILDTDFSPDQRMLIYSSWSQYVHMCNVYGEHTMHHPLDFNRPTSRHFCLFSIKFSPDSREIVAGSSTNHLYTYDIETNRVSRSVRAHADDVNTVCFVDDSPYVVLTGSDDCLAKVWDKRESAADGQVGALVGHRGGITHVGSKGDGRYVISNSKDQSIKLWDLRRITPRGSVPCIPARCRWDYRWDDPTPTMRTRRFKDDGSLKTYTGHRVLQTLIRAYFSPLASTGQRFIYAGSACGSIFVYDVLTGDVQMRLRGGHSDLVRDVAWHPELPLLLSTSWDCSVGLWEHKRD